MTYQLRRRQNPAVPAVRKSGAIVLYDGTTKRIQIGDADPTSGFWIRSDGTNIVLSSKVGDIYYGYAAHLGLKHRFWTGGGERVLIDDNGLFSSGRIRGRGIASSGNVDPNAFVYHVREFLFDGADSGTNAIKSNGTGGSSITFDHDSAQGLWTWRNAGAGGASPTVRMLLDAAGNCKATGFNVGDTGEQRLEMHRHDGAAYFHFYAPNETLHGNLYQTTEGVAGTTRRSRVRLYGSIFTGGTVAQIDLLGRSDNGNLPPKIIFYAEEFETPWVLVNGASLGNGWVNYDTATFYPAEYWKDAAGIVHLRGLIRNGTTNTTIFTLPVGYRPTRQVFFSQVAGGGHARVEVNTAGQVYVQSYLPSGSNAYVSLDGINFKSDA